MKKIAVYTLGCKVNQVESESIIEEFRQLGYGLSRKPAEADICIINTCSVTQVSDRKSRNLIRRIARSHPGALLVVTGCLAELHPEELAAIEGVNLVVGSQDKENIPRIVMAAEESPCRDARIIKTASACGSPLNSVLYTSRHRRTRAFVKIADGCESYCSYCVVPYARGPVRSKQAGDIISEIQRLYDLGYREIVLTGINIGYYGRDLEAGTGLREMLSQLLIKVPGDYRIRLGSINPAEISPELIQMIASEERLCRHLHVPLQSGSDRVLQRMGRSYSRNEYLDLLGRINDLIPDVAVTTDVMTGFPGESEADFEETCNLLLDFPFLDFHVFRYSPRPGTLAILLDDPVPDAEREARSQQLLHMALEKKASFMKKMLGKKWRVLVEKADQEGTQRALSDNYVEFRYRGSQAEIGEFIELKAIHCHGHEAVWGEKA